MELKISVHRDPDAFQKLSGPWETLWAHSSCQVPFLLPTWLRIWWKHFGNGNELSLLSLHAPDDRLIGIAPLYRSKTNGWTLQWLGGEELSDAMDFLIWKGLESPAYKVLARWLSQGIPHRGTLDLHFVPEDSPTLSEVNDLLREGWDVEILLEEASPFVLLEEDWEAFLSRRLNGKNRHELRRKLRKIQKSLKPSFHVLDSGEGWDPAFDTFCRLLRLSAPEKARFLTEDKESFFREVGRELHRQGILKLTWLQAGQTPVASALSFIYGDTWGLYNSGYDPAYASYSPGIVLVALTIQLAIQEGLRCYDFFRGREPYKYRFGARDRNLYRVKLSPRQRGDCS